MDWLAQNLPPSSLKLALLDKLQRCDLQHNVVTVSNQVVARVVGDGEVAAFNLS